MLAVFVLIDGANMVVDCSDGCVGVEGCFVSDKDCVPGVLCQLDSSDIEKGLETKLEHNC